MLHNDDNGSIVKYKYSGRNRHHANHAKDTGTEARKTKLYKTKNHVLASRPNQKE